MKRFRKLLSVISAAALTVTAATAACVGANAVVIISDDNFEYTYSNNAWQLYSYIGSDTVVTLPDSYAGMPVNGVLSECFAQSGVTSVTIPDSYQFIGNYAFYNCGELKTVSFPSTLSSIGMGAFAQSGVESADLSETKLDTISSYTFQDCAALTEVELPASTKIIGINAFARSGLEEIVLPYGVTVLGDGCFTDTALTYAELPESLTTIGADAFRNDTALTELYIPDSVTSIGAYALYPMSVRGTLSVTYFEDSYADEYCYENFVTSTRSYQKIMGDSNLDGSVDINDATVIQRHCAGIEHLSQPGKATADADRDGKITVNDATTVQKHLAGYQVFF